MRTADIALYLSQRSTCPRRIYDVIAHKWGNLITSEGLNRSRSSLLTHLINTRVQLILSPYQLQDQRHHRHSHKHPGVGPDILSRP